MPGMNGLAATKEIRKLPPNQSQVPIIAMTANVLPNEIASCYAAGMTAHIGKPFRDRCAASRNRSRVQQADHTRHRVPGRRIGRKKSFLIMVQRKPRARTDHTRASRFQNVAAQITACLHAASDCELFVTTILLYWLALQREERRCLNGRHSGSRYRERER